MDERTESERPTHMNSHNTLSLNEVRDVSLFSDPSSLVPEASSIPGTPRNDNVIDRDQLIGLAIHWWDTKRGYLEVALHDREDVAMQLDRAFVSQATHPTEAEAIPQHR